MVTDLIAAETEPGNVRAKDADHVERKSGRKNRGRSDEERPRDSVVDGQDQLDDLVGAEPAQASREPSPPGAEDKEQSNDNAVDGEAERVNGKGDEEPRRPRRPRSTRIPYSDADGCIVWFKQTHTKDGAATE